MKFFTNITYDQKIWSGFHSNHGLVLLDRNIKANDSEYNGLFFIKCSDWSIYQETGEWEEPNYTYIIKYLKSLDSEKSKDFEKNSIEKINFYINKKEEFRSKVLEFIHNTFLKNKNLSTKSIVKTKRSFRESNCWKCKTTVDNSSDYECLACGWIICSNCGACKQNGCLNYEKH